MGKTRKKINKIKLNKFWKNIFSNKPLVWVVIVIMLAVVFSSPGVRAFLRMPSEAAGLGTGTPPGTASPGWTITQVTNWKGVEIVSDVDKNWLVFYASDPTNPGWLKIYRYNIATPTIQPQLVKGDGFSIKSYPRISGNNIVWVQDKSGIGADVYKYTIGGQTINLTNDAIQEGQVDIYGNYVAYAVTGYHGWEKIVIRRLSDNSIIKTIPKQKYDFVQEIRIENNRVFWLEEEGGMTTSGQATFMCDLNIAGFPVKQLSISPIGEPYIGNFDVSGNLVTAVASGPKIGSDIFTYQVLTGLIGQVTFGGGTSGPPVINKDKIAYLRLIKGVISPDIQELHLYDLSNQTDSNIWSVKPEIDHMTFEEPAITNVNGKVVIIGSIFFNYGTASNTDIYLTTQP